MSAPASESEPLDRDGYAARWATLHGGYDPRQAPAVVRGWLFLAYFVARPLARRSISPNAVTVAGLALSAAVPFVAGLGSGWALAGAGLVVVSALADTVDGALAVTSQRTSRLGQVYDSVADRLAEVAWLVALHLLGGPAWLVVAGGAVAWLHEYVRARATVAGLDEIGVVTLSERPTRIILALFTLLGAGVASLLAERWTGTVVTVGAACWLALGAVGFVQLARAVHRALR